MSDAAIVREGAPARSRRWNGFTGGASVLLFWWLATGALVVMQRTPGWRLTAAALTTAGACVGGWLIRRHREGTSARQVLASFHGGSLLWLWVATMLYGGWIVGTPVTPPATAGGPRTFGLALDAIGATLYNDLVGLACVVVAWGLVRGSPNKAGAWALSAFWGAHQVAKVNLFLGVAYPGVDFLPSYLSHFAGFFGAAGNSPFLYLTIAGFGLLAASLVAQTRRATREGPRMLLALQATLVLLMLVEHTWLGVGSGAALWTLFLSARAT